MAPVDNLHDSLADGVLLWKIMEKLSGKKGKYAKMAKMDIQRMDNWAGLVKFMKSCGIQVDDDANKDPEAESVGLDATSLYELERRELLKIFSKIMVYENTL